jgi:hypothetical protein
MHPSAAAFLPLTFTVLNGVPTDRPETRALDVAARRAEHAAWDTWQALLGDCDRPQTEFTTGLRRLSRAVGMFVGADWWNGAGCGHRDRIAGYQWWLEEAIADGDGAEYAEAFARYDHALARTVLSRTAGSRGGPRRPAAVTVRRSGTMAGWARQARAATTRATHRAVSPLRWATSRRATSSSRWSRHSRSAG